MVPSLADVYLTPSLQRLGHAYNDISSDIESDWTLLLRIAACPACPLRLQDEELLDEEDERYNEIQHKETIGEREGLSATCVGLHDNSLSDRS
jgi:hypothetical protein